jgi:predicted enzyme related to lactoylglutathione lyase
MPDGSYMYTMFSQDGKATAGLGQQPAEMTAQGLPPMWSSYVTVDSVDETVAKWTAAGAR